MVLSMYHGKFFEMKKWNNFLWWNKISLICTLNKFLVLVSKGILVCFLECCTNPLNRVPTGIILPRTTFSFRPFNQLIRPRRTAFDIHIYRERERHPHTTFLRGSIKNSVSVHLHWFSTYNYKFIYMSPLIWFWYAYINRERET